MFYITGFGCRLDTRFENLNESRMNARVAKALADVAHIPIMGLAKLRALPEAQDYDSGIYFLWANTTLLYIGKSRNLSRRAYEQRTLKRYAPFQIGERSKPIPYDLMTCLVLENDPVCSPGLDLKLQAYERAYIAAYEPPYNEDEWLGTT